MQQQTCVLCCPCYHNRYRQDASILKGVSFKVPAGTSCAVVGASGSGKSTILRLLFRYEVCRHDFRMIAHADS